MPTQALQGAKLSRYGVCKHAEKVQDSLSGTSTRAMVTQYDHVLLQPLDDRDIYFGVGDDIVADGNKQSVSSCAVIQSPRDDQREPVEPLCAGA